jgi:UDP-N-acetylglucosamine acyltransferase
MADSSESAAALTFIPMASVHPTAIVDRGVDLGEGVIIGAYSIIKPGVKIGAGTVIQEHCHIHGVTSIGQKCRIGPNAYVGLPPQHLKCDGANTRAIIGDEVVIREGASVHRSISTDEGRATRIGDRCFVMASGHVGHDCVLGQDVVIAHGAMLGGHCIVGDKAFVGGGAAIHQFVRIGRLAIIKGNEGVTSDVPPFAAVRYDGLKGYNAIGCKRSGMPPKTLRAIRSAFHCLHVHRTLPRAIEAIHELVPMLPEIEELLEFFATTKRGVLGSVRGAALARFGAGRRTALEAEAE